MDLHSPPPSREYPPVPHGARFVHDDEGPGCCFLDNAKCPLNPPAGKNRVQNIHLSHTSAPNQLRDTEVLVPKRRRYIRTSDGNHRPHRRQAQCHPFLEKHAHVVPGCETSGIPDHEKGTFEMIDHAAHGHNPHENLEKAYERYENLRVPDDQQHPCGCHGHVQNPEAEDGQGAPGAGEEIGNHRRWVLDLRTGGGPHRRGH